MDGLSVEHLNQEEISEISHFTRLYIKVLRIEEQEDQFGIVNWGKEQLGKNTFLKGQLSRISRGLCTFV